MSKNSYPKCNCCGNETYKASMKIALSDVEREEKRYLVHYKELEINPIDSLHANNSDWACDYCLNSNKAIRANPSAQNYRWYPRYAYFDTQHTCKKCKEPFRFSKHEKKFWFEELGFWHESEPIHCKTCRKEVREQKEENKMVSQLLRKRETELNIEELESVIAIYQKWEKTPRVNYFKKLLKKRLKL